MRKARISVILPTLNEADGIVDSLRPLQTWRLRGHEIILADGGSDDATVTLAGPWVDKVMHTDRGRARQMNAGARTARNDVLLFLHADTQLPPGADTLILNAMQARDWGRFDVRLTGAHPLLRVVETLMNWRSRLTGVATGDQAIFVRRSLFEKSGGYPEIPLMEDVALARALKKHGPPLCLKQRVLTSSRRWERHGVLRTILLMWRLRLAYALGADPRRLVKSYYK